MDYLNVVKNPCKDPKTGFLTVRCDWRDRNRNGRTVESIRC